MRQSKVLGKLRSGKAARICSMGHYLPFFVRYAAHYGYDGIWLDLEHRAMESREVQSLLAFCRMFEIDCMVRPASVERSRLYRYLEDGATGFLVPFASDVETAQEIVSAAKFPPLGNRGLDGSSIDGDFGLESWRDIGRYTTDANSETFIFAQIETPEAISRAQEIAALPGIDGLFVGSADLGLRLSVTSTPSALNLDDAIEQVSAAARRCGKAWGAATASVDKLRRYQRMGAQILPWGGEFELRGVLANCSAELESLLGDEQATAQR
jgi:4-hydroxy-2-oxoheptanedioate aldolase